MTHRDRGIVAALAVVLIALAIAAGLPGSTQGVAEASPIPIASGAGPRRANPLHRPDVVYREGTVGRPSSITPLTARTQADRDLVALVFSGLVKLGPDGTYQGDLASGWTVTPDGRTWTFAIRDDARWQDGAPVTAADVAFTVDAIHSPGYSGPLGASWRDVTATVVDDKTVTFQVSTPLGGFLQAATVGLLPAHLLDQVPVEALADGPFSVQPVGSGPFVLVSWDFDSASLVPASAADIPAVDPAGSTDTPSDTPTESHGPGPTPDRPTGPGPTPTPAAIAETFPPASPDSSPGESRWRARPRARPRVRPRSQRRVRRRARPSARRRVRRRVSAPGEPALPGIEMSFFKDAGALAEAFRAGGLDAAAGLPPDLADPLAALRGNRSPSATHDHAECDRPEPASGQR